MGICAGARSSGVLLLGRLRAVSISRVLERPLLKSSGRREATSVDRPSQRPRNRPPTWACSNTASSARTLCCAASTSTEALLAADLAALSSA
jgi:hypothetical protein